MTAGASSLPQDAAVAAGAIPPAAAPRRLEWAHPDELKTEAAFRDAVPALAPNDFDRLRKSIRTDGEVREPIIVDTANVVVDGHHRLRIAQEAGLTQVPIVRLSGALDRTTGTRYAIEANLHRRQLTPFQVVELAKHVIDEEVAASKRAKATGKKAGRTNERIAERLNVGKDTVKRARKVLASTDPDDEVRDLLRAGKASLKDAAETIDRDAGRRREKQGARQAALNPDRRYRLIVLDLRWEAWLSECGGNAYYADDVRENRLESLPITPAELVEKFAAPDCVVVASLTPQQLVAAGINLIPAFGGCAVDDLGHATTSEFIAVQQVILTGGRTPDGYTGPHGYLLHFAVNSTGAPPEPAAVALSPSLLQAATPDQLAAAWPGPGLFVVADGKPAPASLPAAWDYVMHSDLADGALKPTTTTPTPPPPPVPPTEPGGNDPEWRRFADDDGATAPPESFRQEQAKAKAKAAKSAPPRKPSIGAQVEQAIEAERRDGDAKPKKPAPPRAHFPHVGADSDDEAVWQTPALATRARRAWLKALAKAAGSSMGETHLWLTISHGSPADTHPADIMVKATTTPRPPRGCKHWHPLPYIPHKAIPVAFGRKAARAPNLIDRLAAMPWDNIAGAAGGPLTGSKRTDERLQEAARVIESDVVALRGGALEWQSRDVAARSKKERAETARMNRARARERNAAAAAKKKPKPKR